MKRRIFVLSLVSCALAGLLATAGCGVGTENTPTPLPASSATPQAIPTTTQQPDSTTAAVPPTRVTGTTRTATPPTSSGQVPVDSASVR